MKTKRIVAVLAITTALLLILAVVSPFLLKQPAPRKFSGAAAFTDVQTQLSFGSRAPGSEGHQQQVEWMRAELEKAGWQVVMQELTHNDQTVINVIARRGKSGESIILGAHYDTRLVADQDPDPAKRQDPVPGGNDGASGVAVLLELARCLPTDLEKQVTLAFFDAEDQGNLSPWSVWSVGASLFADNLSTKPDAVIILDMIGDSDLNIFKERNSDSALMDQIWQVAQNSGYGKYFNSSYKHQMQDDHIPFINLGIPAVDIIDFDYPYWHTTSDTADKVSPQSLEAVGVTIYNWITEP